MKFKDLVANSLPRVRGRKNKKSTYTTHAQPHVSANQEPDFSTCPRYYPQHPVLDSRESSVERSSTVAVVDAPWRDNAVYKSRGNRTRPEDLGLVAQPITYYAPPPPHHGMVMSHSADGISSQATMALLMTSSRGYMNGSKVTTLSDHYATGDYQPHNMSAISESAVNYIGPNCFYHTQYQHQHHHHHHSHDHHYVYHHHHHRQPQPQAQVIKPTPLTEKTHQQVCNVSNTQPPPTGSEKPRKPESGGFFRKSFASFRAMRKQGSRNKEQEARQNLPSDENEKCMVCPYPQTQNSDKNGSERKQLKQSRKGLKSLTKSKKKKDSNHDSDASWYSDNDSKKHHIYNLDSVPFTAPQKFPILECSMESSIPRHPTSGSREGSYVRELDNQHNLETASLSGYDSDVTKNRSGRSRSRIKTNPWLPSPQPSLTMGRRFENCHFRESHEDVMEEDNMNMSFFPRSASFDYHSQLGLSSFQSPAGGQEDSKRSVQRHRSLTPVDLKLNLSLPKVKPLEPTKSSNRIEEPRPDQGATEMDKSLLNDLNTKLTKSRPNSIVSPNSEFIALADNIEQLANNISFEYEDAFNASIEHENGLPREKSNSKINRLAMEENNPKRRKSETSSPFPNDTISDNAHSPDSGIGCMGSCDGDDVMTNSLILEQSPIITTPPGISRPSRRNFNSSETFNQSDGPQISAPSQNCAVIDEILDGKQVSKLCKTKNVFSQNNCETSPSGSPGNRLQASSSNESLNSGIISESDIDNTSYKYTDNMMSCSLMADSSKPLNSPGSLMVEERLDVNFRSLPRKAAGNRIKKPGHKQVCESHTIGRMKNIKMENECTSSMVAVDNSSPNKNPETICRLKNKQTSVANQRENKMRLSADNEQCGEMDYRSGHFVCLPEGQCSNDLLKTDNEPASYFTDLTTPLVVRLDGNQPFEVRDGNDVIMKGHDIYPQETIDKYKHPFGFRNPGMETCSQFVQMETTKDNGGLNTSGEMLDTVDVSVQTDFFDYESWERRHASPLPDLDDSFDPAESTRRWLLSGNMQGSADTGYSSQARDSHVFMEDEAALLQFDVLCDKGFQTKNRGDSSSSLQKGNPSASDDPPFQFTYFSNETYGLPMLSGETNSVWTPPALTTFGPHSNPSDGHLDAPIRKRNVENTDINKRHSSDSSTSTLTSDMPELDVDNNPTTKQNGVKDDDNMCGQQIPNSFVTTTDKPEPDYVNLPSQSYCNKHRHHDKHSVLGRGKNETHRKCTKCLCSHSSSDSQNNKLKMKGIVSEKESHNRNMNSFHASENVVSHFDEDRADYLEFLKDAPLHNCYRKNPVFVIPGFGPVEFPSERFELYPNFDDFHGHDGRMSNAGVLNFCERLDRSNRVVGSTQGKKGCAKDSVSRCKGNKAPKGKKEDKILLSSPLPCVGSITNTDVQPAQIDDTRGEKMKSCHAVSGKKKSHLNKDSRTDRCPTVQSYDVDNYPPTSKGSSYSFHPGQAPESPLLTDKSGASIKDNSTRNLAERVSLLRREKEIIYRKIQEVQQQELSRQREQLQQQRHLHSQRKDELLETLHDLKEKLEEQSKMLQMKCGEEI